MECGTLRCVAMGVVGFGLSKLVGWDKRYTAPSQHAPQQEKTERTEKVLQRHSLPAPVPYDLHPVPAFVIRDSLASFLL